MGYRGLHCQFAGHFYRSLYSWTQQLSQELCHMGSLYLPGICGTHFYPAFQFTLSDRTSIDVLTFSFCAVSKNVSWCMTESLSWILTIFFWSCYFLSFIAETMDCSHKAYILMSPTKNTQIQIWKSVRWQSMSYLGFLKSTDFMILYALIAHQTLDFKLMQRNLMKWMGTFRNTNICYSLYNPIYVNYNLYLIWEKYKLLTKKSCGYQFLKPPAVLTSCFPVTGKRVGMWL